MERDKKKQKKNIAFIAQPIDPVLPPNQNSIGIIIYEIAKRLTVDHDVVIFVNKSRNRREYDKNRKVRIRLINTHADKYFNKFARIIARLRRNRLSPYYSSIFHYFSYSIKIAIQINRLKCEIVHIVNFSQFIPIIRFFNPRTKIVIHMECEWLSQLDDKMIKKRIDKVDHIVGCSEFITNMVKTKFNTNSNKYSTIYNGVDFDLFRPAVSLEKKQVYDKKILFVGRISPEKGVHDLIKSSELISKYVPDFVILLVGPVRAAPAEYILAVSDDPIVHNLSSFSKSYASKLHGLIPIKFRDRVNFINNIPYNELVNIYQKTDVFVFPSSWNEPFGMPVIEAMACGIPVVSTKSGGIVELIKDGQTGLLVERGDPTGLAKAIIKVLTNDSLKKRMGDKGRKRVIKKFSWDIIAKDFEELYLRL